MKKGEYQMIVIMNKIKHKRELLDKKTIFVMEMRNLTQEFQITLKLEEAKQQSF